MKNTFMCLVAKAAIAVADKAGNSTSVFSMHQPKEPDNIQHRLDAMKKKQ